MTRIVPVRPAAGDTDRRELVDGATVACDARRRDDVPEAAGGDGPGGRTAERSGFDGMLLTEGGRTAYSAATAAALGAPGLELSTGVAVAFPRSPMITAQNAWELQEVDRRPIPARARHPGEDPRGPALRRRVRPSGSTAPRLRACREGLLRRLPRRTPRPSRRLLRVDVPQPAVESRTARRRRPEGRRRRGQPLDAHDGGRGRRRCPRASDRRAGVPRTPRVAVSVGRCDPSRSTRRRRRRDRARDDHRGRHRRAAQRRHASSARASLSFYGSTPNYAFIWDEAGFEGTTARIRAKQKAGDFAGMAAEITDDHLTAFCTEASWDDLADRIDRDLRRDGEPTRALQRRDGGRRDARTLRRGRAHHLGAGPLPGERHPAASRSWRAPSLALTACQTTDDSSARPRLRLPNVRYAVQPSACEPTGATRMTTSEVAR